MMPGILVCQEANLLLLMLRRSDGSLLPIDWVKLNTGWGASRGNPGEASRGGVLRGSRVSWVVGFGLRFGVQDAFFAELQAIHQGLQISWDPGYRQIILESDSQVRLMMIENPPHNHPRYTYLIRSIKGYSSQAME